MKRYIVTGAPGAGKTMLVAALRGEGFATVAEAATDIITRAQTSGVDAPWELPGFVEKIATLQERRIASCTDPVQIHDRSPICTYALAVHLGVAVPAGLARLLDRIATERTFAQTVFLVESLDTIEATAARRIGLEDAKRFGALHAKIYTDLGYELVPVAAAPVEARTAFLRAQLVA